MSMTKPSASQINFTPSGTLSSTNVQAAITELVTDLAASSGSSMVGYLPAGIGAVGRTVQSKLRESVSVLDFGAVGDGVTDDTVAIQKAIDYVQNTYSPGAYGSNSPAAGPSELFFPAGLYSISAALQVTKKIAIKGDGQSEYSSGSRILQTNPNQHTFNITPIPSGMSFSTEKITLRGSGTGTGNLINISTSGCNSQRYVDTTFGQPAGRGARVMGDDICFQNCLFDVIAGNAVELGTNTAGQVASNVRFVNTNFFMVFGRSITLFNVDGLTVTGCVNYSDGSMFTLRFIDGIDSTPTLIKNVTLTGNTIKYARCVFGATNATNTVITGNTCSKLGIGAGESENAINLFGTISGITISGNLFSGQYDSKHIYDDSGASVSWANISGNSLINQGGSGIGLIAANTEGVISNNSFVGYAAPSVSEKFLISGIFPGGKVITSMSADGAAASVTGCVLNDCISLSYGATLTFPTGITMLPRISSSNTVTFEYRNSSTITLTVPEHSIYACVTRGN